MGPHVAVLRAGTMMPSKGKAAEAPEAGAKEHAVPLALSGWKAGGFAPGGLRGFKGASGSYVPDSGADTCVCPAWLSSLGTLSS